MNKPIRKAVRCYVIKDNNVLVTKYKQGNKEGYYDIPGGKIEEGEFPEQTAIREMREETGLDVKELKYKGNMIIEYPNRIFDLDVFLATESEGEPQELLQKEKILSNIIVLDSFFIKGLIDDNYNFKMNVKVDEQENILSVNYELNKNV